MTPLRTRLERRDGALLMGVLNRTPDSFSDGGRYLDEAAALGQVEAMIREGAAIIDVGAESTRPGAPAVGAKEQVERLGDLKGLGARATALGALVSIDTTLPEVAEHALRSGVAIVNSVSLEPARDLGELVRGHGASLVLMHCRGSMTDMAGFSAYPDAAYGDVVADVAREWSVAAAKALGTGLSREDLVLDPGLGFAKNARQSLELCARLDELVCLGFPVLVGASRKSFVARAAAGDGPLPLPGERLGGTIAATLACVEKGAAIARVHDVGAVGQALAVARAMKRAGRSAGPRALGGADV